MEPREVNYRAKEAGRDRRWRHCTRCPDGYFKRGYGLYDNGPVCWECCIRELASTFSRSRSSA